MSDDLKSCGDTTKVGFYVRELDAGAYSVRLDLVSLLTDPAIIRHFHHWCITRHPSDKIWIYLEHGATPNIWASNGSMVTNVANVVKAVQLCPAYENLKIIVSQMVTGAGAYLVLSTPQVVWGPLGFVSFDGWLSGKSVEEYDQAFRSDIKWIKAYFRRGVKLGLFTEEQVKDYEDGRMIALGLNKNV